MHLNIKNDEAYEMAKELSQLTGENLTQAVIKAIREQLELERSRARARRQGLGSELKALAKEYQALPKKDSREGDEILYNKMGLPKRRKTK